MQRFNLTRQFFRDVWYLTKSYWQSEEKKKAFFLLGCIIALTLGVVYMLVLLNQWNNSFYSALQNYDAKKIFDELIHFSWLAAIYILLAVYSYYLVDCKCKLNKIYQATISVEYTLSRKVSNSSSGL